MAGIVHTLDDYIKLTKSYIADLDLILRLLQDAATLQESLVEQGISRALIGSRINECMTEIQRQADYVTSAIADFNPSGIGPLEFHANIETGDCIQLGSSGGDRKVRLYQVASSSYLDGVDLDSYFELSGITTSSFNGFYRVMASSYSGSTVTFVPFSSYGSGPNIPSSSGFTSHYEGSWRLTYKF